MGSLHSIQDIISDFKQGKMVLLVDDEGRENEGDLVCAASTVTPQQINFMATHGRGLICLSMTAEQIKKLELPLMRSEKHSQGKMQTAFTFSIEAREGVSTGISAFDRSHTIHTAINPAATAHDIVCPGHIFPLIAHVDGVLGRDGHTEASVDLAKISGLNPAAVICEVMNDDGTMSRLPQLLEFAKKHEIKIGTIESLIEYRKKLKNG